VEAHFTLVFPFEGVPQDNVAAHASAVASSTPAVAFRLTGVAAVSDGLGAGSHVFLLPSEGEAELRRLHRELYSGVLAPKLRQDLPYQPHVTVGAFEQHADAERTAAALAPCDVPGRLISIKLAAFDGRTVAPLHDFPLR
jgi:2'-5' RNA ligase